MSSCVWIVKWCHDGEIGIVHESKPDWEPEGFLWKGPDLAPGFRIDLTDSADSPGAGQFMNAAMVHYAEKLNAMFAQVPPVPPLIPGTRLIAPSTDPAATSLVRYKGRVEVEPPAVGSVTGTFKRGYSSALPLRDDPSLTPARKTLNDAMMENIDNWGKDLAGIVPCLRCGGPAGYLGIRCERVGGCRTAEELIGEPPEVREWSKDGEPRFTAIGQIPGRSPEHWIQVVQPTRELAIQAWRETVLKALR